MHWRSHYNHLLYHVSPSSLCGQFLKLLNVHKACSDEIEGPALSLQLYLPPLSAIHWLSHAFHLFNCERHREKGTSTLNTRDFRFMFEIMAELKVGGNVRS